MNLPPIRIVKVGGSLLSWPDAPASLQRWLEQQPEMRNVFLSGGGDFTHLVQAAEEMHQLTQAQSHWICVDLLRATSRLLSSLVVGSRLVHDWDQLKKTLHETPVAVPLVLDPGNFLSEFESCLAGAKLPWTWDTTSDSIAARLAGCLEAEELVLLKSVDAPIEKSLPKLSDAGLVDRFFFRAATSVAQVRLVNLRCPQFLEAVYRHGELEASTIRG